MVSKKARYLLLTGLLLFCGGLAFVYFFTGEEARIGRQIENLKTTVVKNGSETELAAGIRTKKLRRLFAAPCRIEASVYAVSKTFAAGEIGRSIMAARTPYSRIGIDIYDLKVMDIRNDRACVKFTASVDLLPYGGSSMTDMHEVECRLKKKHGKWLFSEIRTVEVLER